MNYIRKRWAAVIATAVAVGLALTGCSAGSTFSGKSASTQSLAVGLIASPANLDFTTTAGAAIPQALLYNVYETLVKIDQSGKIVPSLATSWTVSGDRKTYDFKLRDGVKFTNGTPFNADTVKFNIDRVKDGKSWTANSPTMMDVVKNVDVVSPTDVKINLKEPSNGWLFNMAGPVGAMFTSNAVSNLKTTAVGTGPYTVQSYKPQVSLTMKKNAGYWGKAPTFSTVTLNYYADAAAQTNALRSGQIQLAFQLPTTEAVPAFKGNSKFKIYDGSSTGEVMMAMNNATGPLKNKKVRQALMYAINRKAVRDSVTNGYGELIGAMVPPSDPWYDASLQNLYPYNPTKAKQLLQEAKAMNLNLKFNVPNLPYATQAAQVVQSELKQVGVSTTIKTEEFPAVWLDQVFTKHQYDLSIINHAEPRDVATVFSKGYYTGYQNTAVQQQFVDADKASDAQYVALMKQATRQVAEDAAADWLWLSPCVSIADAALTNVPQNQTSLSLDLSTIGTK